ncbi:protein translocase subunit SecD [Parvularcula marina]|uniref:Protein translocase subunit SecD n=1 Tax=Parvularcula marina TaxID=2292771 RepID=A0A371RF68_9PROT|nr:protein translocase subunit SecD [Parvularcula marina]RFB04087.1 protein translocase subunit SecD [Parvularcula marina]
MLQFNKWQVGTVIFLILLGAYFTVPNFFPKDPTSDSGYAQVPGFADTRVTLGLDLQGGSYLLLEVDTDEVLVNRITSMQSDIRRLLRRGDEGRITFGAINVDTENYSLTVPITNADDVDRAMRSLRPLARPLGGIGGLAGAGRDVRITQDGQNITIAMTDEAQTFYADDAVSSSIEVIRRRIDAMGTTEPQIQRQGPNRLVVQVPGNSDSEALQNVINAQGQLSFHMVDSAADPNAPTPPRRIKVPMGNMTSAPGTQLVLFATPDVTGDMVTDASASPNSDGGGFQVNFAFDTRGARRFSDVTRNNVGRQFAIVLDDEIISAPRIINPITGGSGRITGNFTPDDATQLAILIKAGALPAALTTIEQRTVGADLGADSVRAGTIALIIGFTAVIIFIVVTYGRFGIYADLALLANVLLIAGALSLLGATLTLPGIAGIVLTIGMAVDANVLIFERIREELEAGKKPVQAVEAGYRHAWSAIFDANLTTLIAALIMFQLGAGPVRGFAVTLGIGVLTSVFTAFVVTRIFTGNYVLSKRPKELKI